MKKTLLFLNLTTILVMLSVTFLTSCGDDEPSNSNPTNTDGPSSGTALAVGANFSVDNIKYTVISTDKEVAAIGLEDKNVPSVEIPASVKQNGSFYKVVRVGIEHDDLNQYWYYIDGYIHWGTVIRSVKIPESVTRITNDAFSRCSFLTDISIPNSVISIGYGAFIDTKWQQGQENQEIIYAGLVAYDLNLNREKFINSPVIRIKDGTQSIGDCLCRDLESAHPKSHWYQWENWDGSPFNDESLRWSVLLPNSVIHIGKYAFAHNYKALKSVNLPSSLKSIDEYAFWNCNLFTSVTIPKSVSFIGKGAFGACYGLREVHSKIENPFPIEPKTFDNPSEGIRLYVPRGTRQKYLNTKGWNSIYEIIEE